MRQNITLPRPPQGVDDETRRWANALISQLDLILQDLATPASKETINVANGTIDRDIDADSTTVAELADVVYTLIVDLRNKGILK